MKNRRVAVFTGNRAEYGLQFPILKALSEHPHIDYNLIVSGAHLDKNFGETLAEIESDGFIITEEVKIEMDAENLESNVHAIGSGVISIGKALARIKPDIMVVYADRFESFAFAVSAMSLTTAFGPKFSFI